MNWEQIPLGALETNCYLLSNKAKSCLIIDPGDNGKKLIQHIQMRKLKPVAILLTHAHFDHIGAVEEVRDLFKVPVYLHEREAKWLADPSLNGSQFFMTGNLVRVKAAEHLLMKEEHLAIGDFKFQVLETPGHSPGSVSFFFEEELVVVSGDALFQGSIGRTDLRGGNHDQLIKSIHNKLLVLPEDTIVLPGHGDTTTIMDEMDSNPFLNGF